MVNGIYKRGGTIIGTSRGGYDNNKIVSSIEDRGINQVKLCEKGVTLSVVLYGSFWDIFMTIMVLFI